MGAVHQANGAVDVLEPGPNTWLTSVVLGGAPHPACCTDGRHLSQAVGEAPPVDRDRGAAAVAARRWGRTNVVAAWRRPRERLRGHAAGPWRYPLMLRETVRRASMAAPTR